MKNRELQKYHTAGNSLTPSSYTLALLHEACRKGILEKPAVDDFQNQLMTILGELIIKYTNGESSSVTLETAQRLLGSILYSTDAFLSSFSHKGAAIACLKTWEASEIYKKGFYLVISCLEHTQELYEEIRDNKLNIPVKAYHMTIDKDLPDFLESYDALFYAQNTMATMDYPLLSDDMAIQGIFYIEQYLRKLAMETRFCHMYSSRDINSLLSGYGRVYRIDYSESLINVFEILLTNTIFSVLAGNQALDPIIGEAQFACVSDMFKDLDHNECSTLISQAIDKLLKGLAINEPDLIDYLAGFNSLFMPRFLNARENKCLTNVIIVDHPRQDSANFVFDEGQRLNDEAFRDLVEQIRECREPLVKARIIKEQIQSLADFLDILEASCLFDDDYNALFNSLGDLELSILAGFVFTEQIRENSIVLSIYNSQNIELEHIWQQELAQYLKTLNPERLQSIAEKLENPIKSF